MIDIDKLTEGFDFSGYESPVKMFQEQIRIDVENDIMKAVRKVGVLVDKEELIKALKNDREQYKKGYMDGLNANKWISVSDRLPKTNGVYNIIRTINNLEGENIYYISDSAYFDGTRTWHDDTRVNHSRPYLKNVLAWMPLPESHKEEGAE